MKAHMLGFHTSVELRGELQLIRHHLVCKETSFNLERV